MSNLTFSRSIAFTIPGSKGAPGVKVTAVEDGNGNLSFSADVLNTGKSAYDLRGLFFNFNDDGKLHDLGVNGSLVTAFDTVNVIDLGNGINMQGAANPFDVGVGFGASGTSKNLSTSFLLANAEHNLSLDDIANVTFGARLTSNSNSGASKLLVTAPAAPDAHNDLYSIFEDGQAGLNAPAETAQSVVFQVLENDTDADHNTLTVVALRNVEHGVAEIVDGNDLDTAIGDAVRFTPTNDYSGQAGFEYAISDNAGGTDFAHTVVDITAVADKPILHYEILAGETPQQFTLRVTATPTDDDHSEFIDRILLSGHEGKVENIATTGLHPKSIDHGDGNVTLDPSGAVSQDFVITLFDGQDTHFDLGITAVSQEMSNADEESQSTTVNVCLEHSENDRQTTFTADDQSQWKDGNAFLYSNSWNLGFDQSWNKSGDWTIYDDDIATYVKLSAGTDGRIAAYLTPSVTFNGGSVDAAAPYQITVTTDYNKTSDLLDISSSALVQPNVTLNTTGPSGSLALLFSAYFAANFHGDLKTSIGDANLFNVGIGPWNVDNYQLLHMTTADVSVDIPVSDFGSITAAWPTLNTSLTSSNPQAGAYVASGESNNFLQANLDVDKLLSDIVWLIATEGESTGVDPFGDELDLSIAGFGVKAWYDLFDVDVNAGLNFIQNFTMDLTGMSARITYENGAQQALTIGSDLILKNASSYDTDHDGSVEFTVTLDPLATLRNDTDLGFNVGYALNALDAGVSYDFLFIDGSYSVGPVWQMSGSAPITTVGVYDKAFDLNFASQDLSFSA